jgi:small subunit ribosomal protein S10
MYIKLVLKSYEKSLLMKACRLLLFVGKTIELKTQQHWAMSLQSLPTKLKKYTVLRSPHIDKKSREQFELKTYQKALEFKNIKNKFIFLLFLDTIKLVQLNGVQLKCTFKAQTRL